MFGGIDKSILNDWFLNHVLNGLKYLSCLNKGIDFKRFVELNKRIFKEELLILKSY